MVLSQSSIKKRLRRKRNIDESSSQSSLNSRNRRDDSIQNVTDAVNISTIPFVPSIVKASGDLANLEFPSRNRLSNRELVVLLKRHPLIRATAVILNSPDSGFQARPNVNRARQLKVILQRNFGDVIGKLILPPSYQPVITSTPAPEMKNLTVRLERSAVISDMIIFKELKRNRMRNLTIAISANRAVNNDSETPTMTPAIWPNTPSPMVLGVPASTNNESQQGETIGSSSQVSAVVENRNRRRRHAEVPHRVTYRDAITVNSAELESICNQPHNCGSLTELCPFCGALFYSKERITRDCEYTGCCNKGAYTVPTLSTCPTSLKELYIGDGPLASQFRSNIRFINSLFAMASFKTSKPIPERRGQGHWCFTICGQIYHYISGIPKAQDADKANLNQIYFLDMEEALTRRNAFAENRVDPALIRKIESLLRTHNRYIKAYKTMGDEIRERKAQNMEVENIIIGMTKEPVVNILAAQQDQENRRPGQSDIAAIFEGSEPPMNVDLVVYPHRPDDPNPAYRHQELKLLNPLADPMVYPLLFPCGDNGYSTDIKYNIRRGNSTRKAVTILQYYRYRLYVRDVFSTIHNGGKLFQQYVIDGWVKHEMSRLWWFRQNQNEFRKTAEETLRRYNRNRQHGHVGRAVILPSGFPGGERYRQRQYLDAMAVVARFGKPDLFITFTCNPNWPEIKSNLFKHQKWENRPDLICRVFQIKLMEFIDDLVHKQMYGIVINYQYVIEFQKRGLPHAHIVITFHEDDKLKEIEMVDQIISARIPDKEEQPQLYQRVAEFQLHAPCGRINPEAPCLVEGKCTKYFPKPYREETTFYVGRNKRPEYKRPADGREIYVERWNRTINNRRVVPYNPYALAKFSCHINFEAVGSLNTIKYLHKYINKGPDSITLYVDSNNADRGEGQRIDEIQDYIDSRYVSGMEATWRTFQYRMHGRSHSVLVLPIHLPGERDLIYNEDDDLEDIDRRLERPSKLEAWFTLNSRDVNARRYKYAEIPEHYVWDNKNGRWYQRSKVSKQIGCLVEVSPSEGRIELFFLRVLLKRIKGATSFDDLLLLEDGVRCVSFREACQRRNWLIDDGNEYEKCLKEAELHHHPRKFRKLFCLICSVAMEQELAQTGRLWLLFKKSLMADFRHSGLNNLEAETACLEEIKKILNRIRPGLSLADLGIEPQSNTDGSNDSEGQDDDDEETIPQPNEEDHQVQQELYTISSLNKDQKGVFLRILKACAKKSKFLIPLEIYEELGDDVTTEQIADSTNESLFYLDGPGGTGKTYLYNTLITVLNDVIGKKTTAVAWTGIAANILKGGTTVHRSFRLPLTLSEETTCGYDMQSPQSNYYRDQVVLIVWDEAPMTPKYAIESVHRYLMDITRRAEPFGGKCVLFGGDFRQILPVVIGAHRNDIINQCIRSSILWKSFVQLKLSTNMRVQRDPAAAVLYEDLGGVSFSDWLLKLGEGVLPRARLNKKAAPIAPDDLIEIPTRFHVNSLEELVEFVYGGNFTASENGTKGILCPTNAAVDRINELIIHRITDADTRTYLSDDSYLGSEDDNFLAPLDLLNSIECPSIPPHELVLKRGAIVMLLRNLDVDEGECNGSRMRIVSLGHHIIECELLTGQRIGDRLFLPRIKMKAQTTMLPKEMVRFQFPIRLAYGMTINKSQGQTLSRVGICLQRPCFTHGQLYVSFSRVASLQGVRIFIEESGKQGSFKFRGKRRFTRNIVFSKVLDMGLNRQESTVDILETASDEEGEIIIGKPGSKSVVPDVVSDPDYDSNDDDDEFERSANRILDDIDRNDPAQEVTTVFDGDDEFWKGGVPFRTDSQLKARVSVFDRPGTSGVTIQSGQRNYNEDTDDDTD